MSTARTVGPLAGVRSLLDGRTPAARSTRRAVVVAVAVLVLLWRARSGTPTSVLVALALVFAVAGTVWLHAQYVDDLDGDQWRPRGWVIALLVVAGGGLLAVGLAGQATGGELPAWPVPVGAVVLAFGAAFALTRARARPSLWTWGQVLVLLLSAGLVLVGTVLLGRVSTTWAAGTLAAGLLLAPYPLTLFAESAVRSMTAADGRWPRPATTGAVGAAGVAVALVVAGVAGSGALVLGCATLALLVAAMVSATHADLLVVMLVVALLGVTPEAVSVPRRVSLTTSVGQPGPADRPTDGLLVALGDSYLSGEGAATYYRGTDEGGGNQCRQAPSSWVAQAGLMPPFRGLVFLACSGARTYHLLRTGPGHPWHLPPVSPTSMPKPRPQKGTSHTQLDAAVRELGLRGSGGRSAARASLVVLSIGGNDAGFSGIGEMCLAPGQCHHRRAIWDAAGNGEQVRRQLEVLYTQVGAAFPDTPVAVVPYPDPIHARADGSIDCGQLALDDGEAAFVREFLVGTGGAEPGRYSLNPLIRRTADTHGFHYVAPMERALADEHLQLCDPLNNGQPGLHFVGLRSVNGVASHRFHPANWLHSSLHPNERGHSAMLRAFATWHASNPRLAVRTSGRASGASAFRTAAEPDEAVPEECDLHDLRLGRDACRELGSQWVGGELRRALWSVGWLLAGLTSLSAGLAAAAFTAWRRRHWRGPDGRPGPVEFP